MHSCARPSCPRGLVRCISPIVSPLWRSEHNRRVASCAYGLSYMHTRTSFCPSPHAAPTPKTERGRRREPGVSKRWRAHANIEKRRCASRRCRPWPPRHEKRPPLWAANPARVSTGVASAGRVCNPSNARTPLVDHALKSLHRCCVPMACVPRVARFTMRGRRPSSTLYGQEPKPYGYVECLCGRRTSSRARRSATSVVVGRPCAHCIGRRHCARWCTRCTHSARNNRSPNIRALRHACSSPPTPSEIQRESDEPHGRRVRRRLPTLDLRSRSSAGGGARTQRVSRMCCKCSQKCDASRRCVHGRGNPSEVTTTSHLQILQPSACRWAARTVPSNCGVAVSTRVASIPSPLR